MGWRLLLSWSCDPDTTNIFLSQTHGWSMCNLALTGHVGLDEKKFENQWTSGPVNTHLISGIYMELFSTCKEIPKLAYRHIRSSYQLFVSLSQFVVYYYTCHHNKPFTYLLPLYLSPGQGHSMPWIPCLKSIEIPSHFA